MSEDIENILFSKFVNRSIPFEFISIKELYERCDKSNFDLSKLHRIEFHALLVVTKGNSKHFIDFKTQELFPGVILPLTKGQVHAFNKTLAIEGYIISFDETFITQNSSEKNLFHFLHLFNEPNIFIKESHLQDLNPHLGILKTELDNTNVNLKTDYLHVAFITLLLQIIRLSNTQNGSYESRRFKDFINFKRLISEYYSESHNAKTYAKKLGVSYKYLNDVCKHIANKTAKAFIDSWLLLEIKRNLLDNTRTSQEIAYKMGFQEHSNFIRFFKKFTGVTPSKFQNKI